MVERDELLLGLQRVAFFFQPSSCLQPERECHMPGTEPLTNRIEVQDGRDRKFAGLVYRTLDVCHSHLAINPIMLTAEDSVFAPLGSHD